MYANVTIERMWMAICVCVVMACTLPRQVIPRENKRPFYNLLFWSFRLKKSGGNFESEFESKCAKSQKLFFDVHLMLVNCCKIFYKQNY